MRIISERKAVVFIPEEAALTSQAAAKYLGMSRQHLVDLIEKDEVPHHKVGTHRRVCFKDLLAFEKVRDKRRRDALDRLKDEVQKSGHSFSDYTGEE